MTPYYCMTCLQEIIECAIYEAKSIVDNVSRLQNEICNAFHILRLHQTIVNTFDETLKMIDDVTHLAQEIDTALTRLVKPVDKPKQMQISDLPKEIVGKIFSYWAENPCAKIVRDSYITPLKQQCEKRLKMRQENPQLARSREREDICHKCWERNKLIYKFEYRHKYGKLIEDRFCIRCC